MPLSLAADVCPPDCIKQSWKVVLMDVNHRRNIAFHINTAAHLRLENCMLTANVPSICETQCRQYHGLIKLCGCLNYMCARWFKTVWNMFKDKWIPPGLMKKLMSESWATLAEGWLINQRNIDKEKWFVGARLQKPDQHRKVNMHNTFHQRHH